MMMICSIKPRVLKPIAIPVPHIAELTAALYSIISAVFKQLNPFNSLNVTILYVSNSVVIQYETTYII